jgi:hypothetical protein
VTSSSPFQSHSHRDWDHSFVFDSDADTDPDTDACGNGERAGFPPFLIVSGRQVADGGLQDRPICERRTGWRRPRRRSRAIPIGRSGHRRPETIPNGITASFSIPMAIPIPIPTRAVTASERASHHSSSCQAGRLPMEGFGTAPFVKEERGGDVLVAVPEPFSGRCGHRCAVISFPSSSGRPSSRRSRSGSGNLRTSTYSGFTLNTLEWYSCVAAAAHPGTETALNAPAAPLFAE